MKSTIDIGGIYIGWIYGDKEDKAKLQKLGVKGHMIWRQPDHPSYEKGYFRHCEATEETLDRLEHDYPDFCRDTFSYTNEEKYQQYLYENGWL